MSNPVAILCLLPFDIRQEVYARLDFNVLTLMTESPLEAMGGALIREEAMNLVYRVLCRDLKSPWELFSHFPGQANESVSLLHVNYSGVC